MFKFLLRHKRAVLIVIIVLALIGVTLGAVLTATGVLAPLGITLKLISIHIGLQGAALITANAAFSLGLATILPTIATVTIASIVDGGRYMSKKIATAFKNITKPKTAPTFQNVKTASTVTPRPSVMSIDKSVESKPLKAPVIFKPRAFNLRYYWKMWFTKDSPTKIALQAQRDIHFADFILRREAYRNILSPLQIAQIIVKYKHIDVFTMDAALIEQLLTNEAAANFLLENIPEIITDQCLIVCLLTHSTKLIDNHINLLSSRFSHPNFIITVDHYLHDYKICCNQEAKENFIIALVKSNAVNMLDDAKTVQFITLVNKLNKDQNPNRFLQKILTAVPKDVQTDLQFYRKFYADLAAKNIPNKQLAEQLLQKPASQFLTLLQRVRLAENYKNDGEFIKHYIDALILDSKQQDNITEELRNAYIHLFEAMPDENISDLLKTLEGNVLKNLIFSLKAAGKPLTELIKLPICANTIFSTYNLYSTLECEELIKGAIYHGTDFIFEHFETLMDVINQSQSGAQLLLNHLNQQLNGLLTPITINRNSDSLLDNHIQSHEAKVLDINPILNEDEQKQVENIFLHLARIYQLFSIEEGMPEGLAAHHAEAEGYFISYAYTHLEVIPRLFSEANKDKYELFISKQAKSELFNKYLNHELEKSKSRAALPEETEPFYNPKRCWGRPIHMDAQKILSQQIETACQPENINNYAWRQCVINLLLGSLNTLSREQIGNLLLAYMDDSFFEKEYEQHQLDKCGNNTITLRDIVIRVCFDNAKSSPELLQLDMIIKFLENPQIRSKLTAEELLSIWKMYENKFYMGVVHTNNAEKLFTNEDDKAECYKILELSENASIKDLQGAYKNQLLRYHPDKQQDPASKIAAEEKFKMVGKAYEKLNLYIKLRDVTIADVHSSTENSAMQHKEVLSQPAPALLKPDATTGLPSIESRRRQPKQPAKHKKLRNYVSHFFKANHARDNKIKFPTSSTLPPTLDKKCNNSKPS